MAPAALSISYDASAPGSATARLDGNLGQARVEGRAQLKGSLSDWDETELSAQLKLNEPDGNKLAGLFFPESRAAGWRGTLPRRAFDQPQRRAEAAANLGFADHGRVAGQLDGAAGLKPLSFKGKVTASSQTPEQFLPGPAAGASGRRAEGVLARQREPDRGCRAFRRPRAERRERPETSLPGISPSAWAASRASMRILSPTRLRCLPLLGYFLSPRQGTHRSALPASLTARPAAAGYLERAAVRALRIPRNRRRGLAQRQDDEAQRHAGTYGRDTARQPRPRAG